MNIAIKQLKESAEHYRLSGNAFHADSVRYHDKATEAYKIADEYDEFIKKIEAIE